MAKNIFSASKPVGDLAHNAFDKSRRDVFSTKCGILTPCFVEDTIPDSKYLVNNVNIVRVDSVQSAPFARMSQNVEYFFVPYSQLWHDFERFYYERGDITRNNSNRPDTTFSTKVPTFNLSAVVAFLWTQFAMLRCYDEVVAAIKAQTQSALKANVTRAIELYRSVWESCDYSTDFYNQQINLAPVMDVHGRYCVEDCMRNFDLLGYGNYLPAFKSFWAILGTDASSVVMEELDTIRNLMTTIDLPQASVLETHLVTLFNHIVQPEQIYGAVYGHYFQNLNRQVSVFRLAAYLKIWSDYFRNSQYDNVANYAYWFNFDYVVSNATSEVSALKVMELLVPRYRQWKKDVFTGGFPSAQFGSVSVAATENPVSISNVVIPSGTSSSAIVAGSGSASYTPGSLVVQGSSNSNLWNVDSSVSALSIRQALAMQRYKERQLRAGNRLPANQRAVFGDRSRYIEDAYVDFIGAIHSSVDFNSVAATAEMGGQFVGDLSSNGVSTHGGQAFTYHSHDFGIIMGLFYILPEAEYDNFGVDRFVTKSETFDFCKPDFANLSLSAVFNFDFNIQRARVGDNSSGTNFYDVDKVISYLARYWESKTSLDKDHGEFYGQSPITISPEYFLTLMEEGHYFDTAVFESVSKGAFSQYVTPRMSDNLLMPTIAALYVSPNAVDNIFYAGGDFHQLSDQFKVNMNHQVSAILPLSVIGLPQ